MSSRMKEGVNPSEFIMTMMEHMNEVEIHGVKMDESDQTLEALMSLPKPFKIYKSNCLSFERKLTWSNLTMEISIMVLALYEKNP